MQKKLTRELSARYGMGAAKGKSVPMGLGEKRVREREPNTLDPMRSSHAVS